MIAPDIDPIAISFPAFEIFGRVFHPAIHWYGLMYVIGFVGGWWVGRLRAARPGSGWRPEEIGDLVFYVALGTILGGRLGYVLFYNLPFYAQNPLKIFALWDGGMSFHGGMLGVGAALWFYARHTRRGWWATVDFLAPLAPLGLGPGRLGNFINQELWGKVTDVPWGMVFKTGGPLPRHPSQLYELALEGVVLFLVMRWYSARPRPAGAITGLFLICYGVFRFLVEFVREPDLQLGYLAFDWVTMGQILSVPMVLFGAWLIWRAYRSDRPAVAA
jgi:phosphatidylglycerol:prolipoprotein diacylglycerol transferase